ncbi:MAG: hypothetical protein EA415_15840 [Sphaerobacteraceae bacterium]|nr:MAG: hypothetical protein EA415_15840 [Sphaerobacteraceae bacterium]
MTSNADVTGNISFGVVFVLIGSLVLLNEFDVLSLTWSFIVPIVLIGAGIAVIVSSQMSGRKPS